LSARQTIHELVVVNFKRELFGNSLTPTVAK